MNKNDLLSIAKQFQTDGEILNCIPFGSGHIHDTFRLINNDKKFNDYILQNVNISVFKDIDNLMNNIQLVTTHLRKKLAEIPGSDPDNEVLTLINTKDNKCYYQHVDGTCWRVFLFLEGTQSYDLIENETQAFEGGRGYGRFLSLLSDLDASQLYEVLPKFHNIESRLNLLQNAVTENKVNRLEEVSSELDFILKHQEQMLTILNMGKEGKIKLQTTHNDTKFNNILLDKNDKAQCVIDLDTVMPGYVAYDFGDAIRTIINTANEDEADLTKIGLNMNLFKGFTKGFIQESKEHLNIHEIDSLAHGCLLLPYIMGVRFLTDYLEGDHYYKIEFPKHNLQRAKNQLKLAELLIENYNILCQIINKESNNLQ